MTTGSPSTELRAQRRINAAVWARVGTIAVLVAGGLGAIALGQIPVGLVLLGAAAGGAVPLPNWTAK